MTEGALIYDAECGFCTASKDWIVARARDRLRAIPSQQLDPTYLAAVGLGPGDVASAAYWISPEGRPFRGARGIGQALRQCRQPWRAVGWLLGSAPGGLLAGPIYRIVARFRHRLPGATAACRIDDL